MGATPSLRRLASRRLSVPLAILVAAVVVPTMGVAAAAPLDLGTAANYAIIANTTITNTGITLIRGNLALVGPSATGFGTGVGVITGRSDIGNDRNDAAAKAEADVLSAHNEATAASPVTLMAGDLGGQTLTPGIYHFGAAATLHGVLTLDGQGQTNPVFIFQIGSTLTTGTAAAVVLTNGAAGCAVFWAVGSSATIGTATELQGNLMATVSITMTTGASIGLGGGRNGGRAFAWNGAITLDTNQIIAPTGSCTAPAATPTPTPRPTAKPTPRPTAKPIATPTPILPVLPSLPALPTPRAATQTPAPAASPSASIVEPSPPVASSSPAPSPIGGLGPVITPPPPPSGSVFIIPADLGGTVTFDGGGFGIIGPFVVPGFLAAASGFLIILLMLGQALGALAWLPVVRRRVGAFGIGRAG